MKINVKVFRAPQGKTVKQEKWQTQVKLVIPERDIEHSRRNFHLTARHAG